MKTLYSQCVITEMYDTAEQHYTKQYWVWKLYSQRVINEMYDTAEQHYTKQYWD